MGSTSQHICRFLRQKQRQDAASSREQARLERSDAEQLYRLDLRPGNSLRERKRLNS